MKSLCYKLPFALWLSAASVLAQDNSLTIEAGRSAGKVSPLHFGLMTEEINHSYDGGLYAELVQNRAFLDAQTPAHWSVIQPAGSAATIALDHASPLNSILTNSLRLEAATALEAAQAGVANDGYWGIPVKPNTKYRASFYARAAAGFNGSIRIAIQSEDGATRFASAKVSKIGPDWKRYTATLETGNVAPTTKTKLVLSLNQPGTVWFNLVSLFPPTYHNRPNGTRVDIMELLAGLKPSFLRFPGGNYVQGDTLPTRFDWKKTIGPLTERPGHQSCWGYRSSDGFGLLEFLEWCEDLKMEPVLAVFAGYNLNHTHVNAGPALEPYIQEALEEIEYVTGDTSTKWGAQRAKDGHPAAFKLHYVEIGNEDFFDTSGSYDARFAQYFDAIKAKYPALKIISTIGNEHANQLVKSRKPDALDEHYYASAANFDQDSPGHWDKYDHSGPEIFVGEWAAYEDVQPWTPPSQKLAPTPSLKSALADAAWMAAMERHSDLIVMQCYAPMFVNVNPGARQWRPDLIGYDALNSYGSPSYYAIQLFSQNHGDTILKATAPASPLHYSATQDSKTGDIYLKIVNTQATAKSLDIKLDGVKSLRSSSLCTTLSSASNTDSNSIDDPRHLIPVTTKVANLKPAFSHTFPPYSITILDLKAL
jgi:alpha-N-arabinofuranosidase